MNGLAAHTIPKWHAALPLHESIFVGFPIRALLRSLRSLFIFLVKLETSLSQRLHRPLYVRVTLTHTHRNGGLDHNGTLPHDMHMCYTCPWLVDPCETNTILYFCIWNSCMDGGYFNALERERKHTYVYYYYYEREGLGGGELNFLFTIQSGQSVPLFPCGLSNPPPSPFFVNA